MFSCLMSLLCCLPLPHPCSPHHCAPPPLHPPLPLLRWRLSSLKAALKLCFFQHSPNCSYKEFEMWTNKRNCSWVMELIKTGFLQIRIISLLDALFSAQTGLLFSVSVLCPSPDTHSSLRLSLILSHISGLCGAPDVTAGQVLGICRRAVWMCVLAPSLSWSQRNICLLFSRQVCSVHLLPASRLFFMTFLRTFSSLLCHSCPNVSYGLKTCWELSGV